MSPHAEFEYHMHLLYDIFIHVPANISVFSLSRSFNFIFFYLSMFISRLFLLLSYGKMQTFMRYSCLFWHTFLFPFYTSDSWDKNVAIITETSILTQRIATKNICSSYLWIVSIQSKAIRFARHYFCISMTQFHSRREKNKLNNAICCSIILHFELCMLLYSHTKMEWKIHKVLQVNWIV